MHTYSFSGLSELERYSTVKVEKIIINKNEEYDNTWICDWQKKKNLQIRSHCFDKVLHSSTPLNSINIFAAGIKTALHILSDDTQR